MPQLAPRGDVRSTVEDVEIMRLDVVQNGSIQLGGGSDGWAAIGVQQAHAGPRFEIDGARAVDLKAHERAPAMVNLSAGDERFVESESRELIER
jgi:hypothetical protein